MPWRYPRKALGMPYRPTIKARKTDSFTVATNWKQLLFECCSTRMKSQIADLRELFDELLIAAYSDELSYEKLFKRLSSQALTGELSASLSPERNELKQQTDRLLNILKALKLRPVKTVTAAGESYLELGKSLVSGKKKKSLAQDVSILLLTKQLTYHRLAQISTLEAMAAALDMENFATLLEQTCSECRNAAAYIGQIEKNILYPALVTPEIKSPLPA